MVELTTKRRKNLYRHDWYNIRDQDLGNYQAPTFHPENWFSFSRIGSRWGTYYLTSWNSLCYQTDSIKAYLYKIWQDLDLEIDEVWLKRKFRTYSGEMSKVLEDVKEYYDKFDSNNEKEAELLIRTSFTYQNE